MREIVFASTNPGKLAEMRVLAAPAGVAILSPAEAKPGVSPPPVDETATSYMGNARLKAAAIASWSGLPALGDDTGLEVEALHGAPGLITARYAGPGCTMEQNIEKVLGALSGQSDRRARFVCALSLAVAPGHYLEVEHHLAGEIALMPAGDGGFGYDCVFLLPEYGRTLAELKGAAVPVQTHRARAMASLMQRLRQCGC